VFHCHDTPVLGPRRIASLQDWIFRYALRHTGDAAITIFPSKHRAPLWLDEAGDPRAPLIVPNGAARDFYPAREDGNALAQRRWESKRVLYLGSMGPENGQPQALCALAALPGEVKLDMAGFGTAEFRRELSDWPPRFRSRLASAFQIGCPTMNATGSRSRPVSAWFFIAR